MKHSERRPARRARSCWFLTGPLAAAVLLSSCVLAEGKEYVVQPYLVTAGAHVTFKVGPTNLLHWVSDSVMAGAKVDALLAKYSGTSVTCDAYRNTRYYGDRCAYRILRATKVSGLLAKGYWPEITTWSEFDDFRYEAMGHTRPRGKGDARSDSCLHVTFTYIDPISVNWTYRTASDPKC